MGIYSKGDNMKKEESKKFVEILKTAYPDATCSLDFTTPFEMLVSVMLCMGIYSNSICNSKGF